MSKAAIAVRPSEAPTTQSEPNFQDLMDLAKTLLSSGFVPAGIKTPAQALAVILTGRELRIGPMQALREIGIINGKPVLAADLQLGIFHRDGGQSRWQKLDEADAVLWLRHPNGVEHTERFTMADAERAGLVSKGDAYKKFPKAMLRSRCITAGLKSVGFLPTAGVYDPGELGAMDVSAPGPLIDPPAAMDANTGELLGAAQMPAAPAAAEPIDARSPCPFDPKKRALADLASNQLKWLKDQLAAKIDEGDERAEAWFAAVAAELERRK